MLKKDSELYKKWSLTAYECYKRGCICDGCINRFYCEINGSKYLYGMPHMKYTVIQLWKNLGTEGFKAFEEQCKRNIDRKV